jgi:hypothetical protein
MSTIAIPQRGQPFDLEFMSQMANAINGLADQIGVSNVSTNKIWIGGTSASELTANETKIVTNQIDVPDFSGQKKAGDEKTFSFGYDGFSFAPAITVTVVSGVSISANLYNVSASQASVRIHVNKAGDVGDVKLNVIAIGKPA